MLEPLTGTNYYIRMNLICQHFLIIFLKNIIGGDTCWTDEAKRMKYPSSSVINGAADNNCTRGTHILPAREYHTGHGISAIPHEALERLPLWPVSSVALIVTPTSTQKQNSNWSRACCYRNPGLDMVEFMEGHRAVKICIPRFFPILYDKDFSCLMAGRILSDTASYPQGVRFNSFLIGQNEDLFCTAQSF